MLKQVLWELRKMVCRWSFLAVLCVVLGFLLFIGGARTGMAEGRDSEYQQFYVQYEGRSSADYEEIRQELLAYEAAHPEEYVMYYENPTTGEREEMNSIRAIGQVNFLRFLSPDPGEHFKGISKDYQEACESELAKRQKEGTMENYGTRLLQKELAIYTTVPERTVVVSGDPNVTPFEGFFGGNYPVASLFLIVFAVSPIYSRERRTQMDTILLTAKRGRKALWAKLVAVVLVSLLAGLLVQIVPLALFYQHYQPAWSASLASLSRLNAKFDFISMSVGQAYLILLGLFLLGSLCAGLVTMLFSSLSRSSISAMGASALLLLYPVLLNLLGGSLPSTDELSPYAIEQTVAQNLQQAVNWLKTLSLTGMQSIVDMGLWFQKYLNFFGWPVPSLAAAAVFGGVVAAVTLITPLWYIRRSKGRAKGHHIQRKRREAAA